MSDNPIRPELNFAVRTEMPDGEGLKPVHAVSLMVNGDAVRNITRIRELRAV